VTCAPSLQRYEYNHHNEWDGMDEAADGPWVRFDDVVRLLQQRENPEMSKIAYKPSKKDKDDKKPSKPMKGGKGACGKAK